MEAITLRLHSEGGWSVDIYIYIYMGEVILLNDLYVKSRVWKCLPKGRLDDKGVLELANIG